ncbi:MAG: S26 family signal peptidase [Cyanobacteria bacterium Co-bin13]|nr:S26 family signal peptidase [Cyanobacteria bacterium Co-bin13]
MNREKFDASRLYGIGGEPHTLRHSRLRDVLLWGLRRRRRLRVVGRSMLPLLRPGEEVLIDPSAYRGVPPLPGDIVVAQQPQKTGLHIIKWVVWVEADGRCYLKGLNLAESTDSRSFGLVRAEAILGRVVCRFP